MILVPTSFRYTPPFTTTVRSLFNCLLFVLIWHHPSPLPRPFTGYENSCAALLRRQCSSCRSLKNENNTVPCHRLVDEGQYVFALRAVIITPKRCTLFAFSTTISSIVSENTSEPLRYKTSHLRTANVRRCQSIVI